FNLMTKKLQKLEKIRKEFIANVSHEFRAPLTSIKGFLEIIKEQNLSHEDIKNSVNIMYKDTKYLEHLLSDLLTLGKLESENISLNKTYIRPKSLISRALNTMKNKINDKNINIKLEIEENLPRIQVDIDRIHQVLINLLDNAVNYSAQDSTITIKAAAAKESDKNVKISVTDQGSGILEEELEKIWQRFYKVDRARKRKQKRGSGLGLAIVKDIIKKHGGQVEVKSTIGKGSTFSFII
ncbi:MAG: sensor histidine kinase, partial [Halanaerobiales bacterium]